MKYNLQAVLSYYFYIKGIIMRWYVLFTKYASVQSVINIIKKIGLYDIKPIHIKRAFIYKKQSKLYKKTVPLFPSYLILESDLSFEFVKTSVSLLKNHTSKVIALLKLSDSQQYNLNPDHKRFLCEVCNAEYIIEPSVYVNSENGIKFISGPLLNKENLIKKVNKHNHSVVLNLPIFDEPLSITLSIISEKESLELFDP